ncbi:ABC transporter permease subunit [Alteromonas sp. a30]|uniref:ABC transporter permease subunit n=1 Tax=Alteromonas sp. a30 TaxID=2730917 RepID=UPI002282A719|nr:ABC transporter permease subunit [Alteromonas sp. a30]MCY7295841.1 ABC transporter permease subunit [Alteromonas sp. a30]
MVRYQFPFRDFFQWALLLPLTIPGYVKANGHVDFLPFPPLLTAISIFTLTLFPVVYLFARYAFLIQSGNLHKASISLGVSRWIHLTQIALPMALPFTVLAGLLVMSVSVFDIGVVSFLSVETLAMGTFQALDNKNIVLGVSSLVFLLVLFVVLFLPFVNYLLKKDRYCPSGEESIPISREILSKTKGGLVTAFFASLLIMGFIIPISQLLLWGAKIKWEYSNARSIFELWSNLALVLVVASVVVLVTLASLVVRKSKARLVRLTTVVGKVSRVLPFIAVAVGTIILLAYWEGDVLSAFLLAYCLHYVGIITYVVFIMLEQLEVSQLRVLTHHGNPQYIQLISTLLAKMFKKENGIVILMILLVLVRDLPVAFASIGHSDWVYLSAMSMVIIGSIPVLFLIWNTRKQGVR